MNESTSAYLRAHRTDAPGSIAAALAGDHQTAKQIPIADLIGYLPMTGLFQPYLAYRSGLLQDQLKPLVPAFATVQYVLGLRTTLDTTDPTIAAQVQTLLSTLEGAGILSAPDVAGFLALGGGWRYDRLTEAEVTSALAQMDHNDTLQALRSAWADLYNRGVSAIDAGALTLEAVLAAAGGG